MGEVGRCKLEFRVDLLVGLPEATRDGNIQHAIDDLTAFRHGNGDGATIEGAELIPVFIGDVERGAVSEAIHAREGGS